MKKLNNGENDEELNGFVGA
ncbi:hypothetical protein CCACVL1_03552 [Corchorus capsularis]|uniref:Uncharacterized protein n=1 Tax=Corchorus capsularis TaxID=210143 RepID=A0A1R3JYM9_COCAP|nr:hypothetical protein CCACVL1_03552 [Corchorus capsularis]